MLSIPTTFTLQSPSCPPHQQLRCRQHQARRVEHHDVVHRGWEPLDDAGEHERAVGVGHEDGTGETLALQVPDWGWGTGGVVVVSGGWGRGVGMNDGRKIVMKACSGAQQVSC